MVEISYSDARRRFAHYLNLTVDDCETIVVHRKGKPDVAMIDAAELRSLRETVHVFRSTANAKRLIEAFDQADQGEGVVMTPAQLHAWAREQGLDEPADDVAAEG